MRLYSRNLIVLIKIYVAIALVVATIFSPLSFSFAPVLLLAWYLCQWRWHISPLVNLMTQYFMVFALAVLCSSFAGLLGVVVALPTLVPFNRALEEYAETVAIRDSPHARTYTSICSVNLAIALAVLAVAIMLNVVVLLLVDAVVIIYFVAIGAYVLRHMPPKPVEETRVQLRILAGKQEQLFIKLNTRTKAGGLLFLKSSYDWLKLSPAVQSLKSGTLTVKIFLTPELSGPSVARLQGYAFDRWGMTQTRFEIEPVQMIVIPRARYATWLVQKYMSGTKPGTLPLITNVASVKPLYGLRRGVEYYGNQIYQPGDSLNNIDWKHTYKQNGLITKQFTKFHGQSAIILINLAAANAEEADKLAYNIIVTAISLAQENVPTALAVYNAEDVVLTTPLLHGQELILGSMQVVKKISTHANAIKYLNPPDLARLRANLDRIRRVESHPARVLTELLQLEYQSLSNDAKSNPCTRALSEVIAKVNEQCSVVVISRRNHDAEALAFNSFVLARSGNAVMSV